MIAPSRLDHLTFKGNLKATRYGWLRLTPAYSVHLISDLIAKNGLSTESRVLDPFCGTGTTALVCAERGIRCDTTDINPFLLWLAEAKTRSYSEDEIVCFQRVAHDVVDMLVQGERSAIGSWVPPLHQIEKWWDVEALEALGRIMSYIQERTADLTSGVADLLRLAFCNAMIACAHVSFGHQSMSFKKKTLQTLPLEMYISPVIEAWHHAVTLLSKSAITPIDAAPLILQCDARRLTEKLERDSYDHVITSPPYPNRMSYIRELRPYMYWLGYLESGRQAGELDWEAIGGTWGIATSNLAKWQTADADVPHDGFAQLLSAIHETSPVLSRYVHKYFVDMWQHVRQIMQVTKPGGKVSYIVGNSKFYEVLLPVEEIFASLFTQAGFCAVDIAVIRKRTSKKELFEFVVSATKPH